MATKKKEPMEPQYIALNTLDDTYAYGSREYVIDVMERWIEDNDADESEIEVFRLGEKIEIAIKLARKITFKPVSL